MDSDLKKTEQGLAKGGFHPPAQEGEGVGVHVTPRMTPTRSGKNTRISRISNSVTHLQSHTNTAITAPSANVALNEECLSVS